MSPQLSLFPPDKSFDQLGSLFVGILIEPPVDRFFARLREVLNERHGPLGRPMGMDRLHITLAFIGDFRGEIPSGVVRQASLACETAAAFQAFPVGFDHVRTFQGGQDGCPLVAGAGESTVLMDFQKSLMMELRGNGLSCKKSPRFDPHVTLFRGAREMSRQAVEPITWTVGEIVLIRSVTGEGRYEHLGRWKLGGGAGFATRSGGL